MTATYVSIFFSKSANQINQCVLFQQEGDISAPEIGKNRRLLLQCGSLVKAALLSAVKVRRRPDIAKTPETDFVSPLETKTSCQL